MVCRICVVRLLIPDFHGIARKIVEALGFEHLEQPFGCRGGDYTDAVSLEDLRIRPVPGLRETHALQILQCVDVREQFLVTFADQADTPTERTLGSWNANRQQARFAFGRGGERADVDQPSCLEFQCPAVLVHQDLRHLEPIFGARLRQREL